MSGIVETGIFEHHDARFRHMVVGSAGLDRIASGLRWAEGPVWFDDLGVLLVSDIPNNRILRWSPGALDGTGLSVFRQPSNFANGHTRDLQGRLVSCEHGARRVTRTEPDGSVTVIADSYRGRRLNSPNDVIVAPDGAIWFTDPTYGILSDYEGYKADPEQDARHVFRVDPQTGTIASVCDDFLQPNGLCLSPDATRLYVADSGASHVPDAPRHIRAFGVDGARLRDAGVFCTIDAGIPDGIRCDDQGNLWSSAADGVHCFGPEGGLIGKVRVPEVVANLCFGGPRRNRLFIASTTSVHAVYLAVNGAQRP